MSLRPAPTFLRVDRRSALRLLASTPALALGGCCLHDYPIATADVFSDRDSSHLPIFGRRPAVDGGIRVIDAHAHFFNASDVPVRGFVAECLGHSAKSEELQKLLKFLGLIAEAVARAAPKAIDELNELRALEAAARQDATPADTAIRVEEYLEKGRREAEQLVVEKTAGSRFLEQYPADDTPWCGRSGTC